MYGESNAYDFGARIHDARIGRFLSKDRYTLFTPYESPYIYAGNNPIQNIDYNGDFKLDAKYKKSHPTLYALVKYYLPNLMYNTAAKEVFMSITGISSENFNKMVSFGSGPEIKVTEEKSSYCGWCPETRNLNQFHPSSDPNTIWLDGYSGGNIDRLEQAAKAALQTGNYNELIENMFITSLISIHEGTHWAYYHYFKGKKRDIDVGGTDKGGDFTNKLFGHRFESTNSTGMDVFNIDKAREYIQNNFGKNKTIGFGLGDNINSKSLDLRMIFGKKAPKENTSKDSKKDGGGLDKILLNPRF
jgi:RHS repeat-associated protein